MDIRTSHLQRMMSERWAKDKRTIIIKIYPLNELIIKICFNRILSEYKVFFFDILKENDF